MSAERIDLDRTILVLAGKAQAGPMIADDNPGITPGAIVGASTDPGRDPGETNPANQIWFDQVSGDDGNIGDFSAPKLTWDGARAIWSPGKTICQKDSTELIIENIDAPTQCQVGTIVKANNPISNPRKWTDIGAGGYVHGEYTACKNYYRNEMLLYGIAEGISESTFRYSANTDPHLEPIALGANISMRAAAWDRFANWTDRGYLAIRYDGSDAVSLDRSDDGITWTRGGPFPPGPKWIIRGHAASRDAIVWVGWSNSGQSVLITTDGVSLLGFRPQTFSPLDICWADAIGIFVAVGTGGKIWKSATGLPGSWTQITTPIDIGTNAIYNVSSNDKGDTIIMAVHTYAGIGSDLVYLSTDGINFQKYQLPAGYYIAYFRVLEYDCGYWYILANPSTDNTILRSSDGIQWDPIESGPTRPSSFDPLLLFRWFACMYGQAFSSAAQLHGPLQFFWQVNLGVTIGSSLLGYNIDRSGIVSHVTSNGVAKNISVAGVYAAAVNAKAKNIDCEDIVASTGALGALVRFDDCRLTRIIFQNRAVFVTTEIEVIIGRTYNAIETVEGIELIQCIVKANEGRALLMNARNGSTINCHIENSVLVSQGYICAEINGNVQDLRILKNTLIGSIKIRGSFNLAELKDLVIRGDIDSNNSIIHEGGDITGNYIGQASAGQNVFIINPLFQNNKDYRLSQIAVGDVLDSPLLGKSINYYYGARARDLGAWSWDRSAVTHYYQKPSFITKPDLGEKIQYTIENPDTEEMIGDDGTPDVFNNPERQIERLTLGWTKHVPESVLEFVKYCMRLRDLSVLVAMNPRKQVSLMVASVDGAHSSNEPVLSVNYTGAITSGAIVLAGDSSYLCSYAIDDGANKWRIILDRPLRQALADLDPVTLSFAEGFGEYVLILPKTLSFQYYDSFRKNLVKGFKLEFIRKY